MTSRSSPRIHPQSTNPDARLSAVFDAVRALTATLAPDKLFDNLIRVVIENSEASTACLLLVEGGRLEIVAQGKMENQRVNVRTNCQGTSFSELPESIVASVQRERVPVILVDAAEATPFSNDPYLINQHVRSVACLPMIGQGDFLGLVYLENDLQPGVFTEERVMLLNLLVAQAAISLENTRYCEHLTKENERMNAVHGELVFQRNLLRTLAETFPHRIYAKDTETRFIFGNMAVAQGMGVTSPDELLGKTDFGFYPEACATRYHREEQAIMQSGQPLMHREEEVKYLLTNDVAWMLTTKVPLRDDDGKVVGIVGVNYDITERKRTEMELVSRNAQLLELNAKLSRAQAQLVQSEKLASIGQLAAGVAHEINNPVGFIFSNFTTLDGYLEKLLVMLTAYEEAEHFIDSQPMRDKLKALGETVDPLFLKEDIPVLMTETKDGIARVRKIVQALTEFSRVGGNVEWQFANLHQGIDATLNIINSEIKYKADVIKEYGQIPEIECLPSEINQVIMNLLVNAAHAIGEDRGKITIRTSVACETVSIEISDNGCGIEKESLSRIFDPFYTTKPVGKGTGLGLSLSYGIVQKHRGTLEAESEVGQGTTFRLALPVKQGRLQTSMANP
ncbi:PAS domain S-box-containing protein [Burkholderia sp. D7]|nr:PAS domain S-box-containing protein [Burkholderia sp. D7]